MDAWNETKMIMWFLFKFSLTKIFSKPWRNYSCLNLKRLGGQFDPAPLPCVSSKERVKSWFFMTFDIIISHIFPESFIETPQVVQKIWIISFSILAIFIDFHPSFGIFWHFLVTKKLMISAYNGLCQHFPLSTYFK